MRSAAEGDDEFWVLTTEPGQRLLAEVVLSPGARPADLMRWRALASMERVAAAIRIAEGRRRGAVKFSRADRMWFERTGLEQATSEPVARHKAQRFAGRTETVVDLCCGIGGDAIVLAAWVDVLAVDLDATMCRRTRWNAKAYDVGDLVATVRGRAESIQVPKGAWVHIDPDRRLKSLAQTKRLEEYQPGLDVLLRLPDMAAGGAIKVSPASDFELHFPREQFEVELVSLRGECKEATVWFGEARTCERRATCLPEGESWTDRDGPKDARTEVGDVQRFVFEPDPALIRSGLLDGFSAKHHLTRYAAGVDYLTGPNLVDSSFLAAFEVMVVMPLDLKRIKREIGVLGIGLLEVKTRGVDHKPEEIREKLRSVEGVPATLLLSGGIGSARAVIARRVGRDNPVL